MSPNANTAPAFFLLFAVLLDRTESSRPGWGVGLASGGLRGLVANAPAGLPRVSEIAIDARALGFAVGVSLFSGVLFGLIPALKYRGPRIAAALHGGGRTASASRDRHRVRGALVIAQVSLALVLLVSAGLMIRTAQALRAVEPGFSHPETLQTMRISIPGALIPDGERAERTLHGIADALSVIPGVSSVAFTTMMPVEGLAPDWDVVMTEGQTLQAGEMPPMRIFKHISPGLFQTAGTRLLAGRDYTWTDLYDKRVVGDSGRRAGQAPSRPPDDSIARSGRRRPGRARQRRACARADRRLLARAQAQPVRARAAGREALRHVRHPE